MHPLKKTSFAIDQALLLLFCCLLAPLPSPLKAEAPEKLSNEDARQLVQEALDYWRDATSHTKASMHVHRSDWERKMAFEGWTKGQKKSLIRFTAPAKDRGSASLTLDNNMWSFAPKINKVIKIPPSMMAQSWMGSDFSYQDLSKGDDILEHYNHKVIATEKHEGKKVYVVEAVPHETAPVVWGKEILKLREDRILLEQEFYDQDFALVKKLSAKEIKVLGGKLYATVVRMEKASDPEEWTEVHHKEADFRISIPERVFTLANLRNPRS